jgi:hypothetical protein
MRSLRLILACAGALAALGVMSAGSVAQDDVPTRAPDCNGIAMTDARDDATAPLPLVGGVSGDSAPQLDLVNAFVTYDGAIARVTMTIADLTKAIAGSGSSNEYYFHFATSDGVLHFVSAVVLADGSITYEHGTEDQNILTSDGATEGEFRAGKDGAVTIVIPEKFVSEGAKLGTAYASTVLGYDLVAVRSLPEADRAPDADSPAVTLKVCPAAPVPAGTPPTPPIAAAGGPLPVKASPLQASARAAKRGIRLTLTASEPLTKVTATLKRSGRTVARGTLATLSGKHALTLKRTAKVAAGQYRLEVTGTDAQGRKRSAAFRVRVTR